MAGCPYCREMHSPLYRCDEQRRAEAAVVNKPVPVHKPVVNKPVVDRPVVNKDVDRRARYRAAHREECNRRSREAMRRRRRGSSASK
jgi:hypothetical protein